MNWKRESYLLTDEKSCADLEWVSAALNTTYWASTRPKEVVSTSIKNSVFLSLLVDDQQIGFVRIVSDYATFAWICDVYVDPSHRKLGLGKWMMECALEHPSTAGTMQMLGTKDAHGLYEKYGFVRGECMRRFQKA